MNAIIALVAVFVECAAPPDTDPAARNAAWSLAQQITKESVPSFERNTAPGAQWFPQAGLGLFMHWGIHSVEGVQPSWAMIKDYPYGGELYPPERYYAQAPRFNPEQYDPDKWLAAAAKAGFTYAVLTAKHHDGYALWPSAFGDMNTRVYMNSRDLLQPYVDACRKYGLKVGFYFSPQDWHYPGYPLSMKGFDYQRRDEPAAITDPEQNQRNFDDFFAYTVGQLNELLLRYGPIDLLWMDGIDWPGIADTHGDAVATWLRKRYPNILLNDRWNAGDFKTPEWNFPDGPPRGWWENCVSWNGHWGFNRSGVFQENSWVLDRLVHARAWGGNVLLNVGPGPDGTMPEGFYQRCNALAQWMTYGRESVIGAAPSLGDNLANVPITTHGSTWFFHALDPKVSEITAQYAPKPASVVLLRNGNPLEYTYSSGDLRIPLPSSERDPLDEVVKVVWEEPPFERDIQTFEKQDRDVLPGPDTIFFVGSSSIRGWNLKESFPDFNVLNRGFGGCQYSHVAMYLDRILIPYSPRTIVLYAGDNDIAQGKSPAWVHADCRGVIHRIRYALPTARIIVIAPKPSRARWNLYPAMRELTQKLLEDTRNYPNLYLLDTQSALVGADGQPKTELFQADGLHLNAAGYAVWADLLRPYLSDSPPK